MTGPSTGQVVGAALLLSITAATSAYGQSVPITLVGDERVVSIWAQGLAEPRQTVTCGARCTVEITPGKYSLTVTTPDGSHSTTELPPGAHVPL